MHKLEIEWAEKNAFERALEAVDRKTAFTIVVSGPSSTYAKTAFAEDRKLEAAQTRGVRRLRSWWQLAWSGFHVSALMAVRNRALLFGGNVVTDDRNSAGQLLIHFSFNRAKNG